MLLVTFNPYKIEVEFHFLEIPASFNLLLGRPWMHPSYFRAVPSTLHQKVRLGLESGMLTIHVDSRICTLTEDNTPC